MCSTVVLEMSSTAYGQIRNYKDKYKGEMCFSALLNLYIVCTEKIDKLGKL